MAVCRQPRAGNDTPADHCQRTLDVATHVGDFRRIVAIGMEKRQAFIQQCRIARGGEVLRQREQRPIDDIAMRVAGADVALAVEEHEPLGPVAIRILLAEYPAQQVADGREASGRQQQFHRSLADIAGAPTAAGILLKPARGEIVHQRIAHPPWMDGGDAVHCLRLRSVLRWLDTR